MKLKNLCIENFFKIAYTITENDISYFKVLCTQQCILEMLKTHIEIYISNNINCIRKKIIIHVL